jgi:hypothetical protein
MVCFNGDTDIFEDSESMSWKAVRVGVQRNYWPTRSDSVATIRATAASEDGRSGRSLTIDPLSVDQIDELQGVAHLQNCWRLIARYNIFMQYPRRSEQGISSR